MKAKQRKHAVTVTTVFMINQAIENMNRARILLRNAEANNAANYVARALKSAVGAWNNAERMLAKQERNR